MPGQRVGYVRVSGFDQNPERQLEPVPLDRLFTEQASSTITSSTQSKRTLIVRGMRGSSAPTSRRVTTALKRLRSVCRSVVSRFEVTVGVGV